MSLKWKLTLILAILLLTPIVYARTYEQPTNITGFQDLFQWEDRVIENKFGVGILLLVFFSSFIILKAFESSQAFTGCLFFTMVVATGCWAIGILDQVWLMGTILLCGLTVILILWTSR